MVTWEKTLSTTPTLVDLEVCSLLSWIALETSFSESPRSLKMEFGVKSYGVFREVTYAVLGSYDSAMNFWDSVARQVRQCHTLQTITNSFWTATASLFGVGINTHPTPPGEAANA
jgi:hypothetical protein